MTNILQAIVNIVNHSSFDLKQQGTGSNRMNDVGVGLEAFVKDAFAGTLYNSQGQHVIQSEVFSWLGNQNQPPDIIIKNGDAIEVKKIENSNSDLALNSSYPKSYLYSDDPMLANGCKNCEKWTKKDIIYCIGHVPKGSQLLKSLWMVYGNMYAADKEIYQRIKNTISEGIEHIPDVIFAETKELGRVNRVDPLGITNLRIRGMWQIQNPRNVFDYIYAPSESKFELVAIIPISKYLSFPERDREKLEEKQSEKLNITDINVKNPNNPALLIPAKMVSYHIR
jgi:hypothetical protein